MLPFYLKALPWLDPVPPTHALLYLSSPLVTLGPAPWPPGAQGPSAHSTQLHSLLSQSALPEARTALLVKCTSGFADTNGPSSTTVSPTHTTAWAPKATSDKLIIT